MIAQEYQPMPDPPHSPWRAVRCRRCSHPLPIPIPPGGRSSRDAVPHPPPLVDRVVPNAVSPKPTPLGTTASTFQDPWRAELPRGRSHTLSRPSFLKTAITAAFLLTWFAGLATAQTPVPPSPPVSPVTVTILCERLAPFQNERFHITLEIKATGLQIAPQIGLSGMPVPDQLVVSPFEELTPERNINAAGIAVETRRFRSRVRATQSGILELAPILEVQAQYRRRLLFGTAIESVPQTIRAQPVKLTVRALPATDRPVGFAGSIGAFTFTREAKPTELAPGELISLVSTITGDGYRIEDLPPAIPLDLEGFKVYPPRLLQKTERILSAEQVIIPLGPHAKTIPALSFALRRFPDGIRPHCPHHSNVYARQQKGGQSPAPSSCNPACALRELLFPPDGGPVRRISCIRTWLPPSLLPLLLLANGQQMPKWLQPATLCNCTQCPD